MNLLLLIIHGLILFTAIRFLIRRAPDPSLHIQGWVSAVLKLVAGICLGLVYGHYYPEGDTHVFHEEAVKLTEYAGRDGWTYFRFLLGLEELPVDSDYLRQPRVIYMAKWVSVFHLITGENYWITSLYFSFFSWWGMWVLTTKVIRNYPAVRAAALFSALYIPSMIFWSSGITKESLALGAFGFVIHYLVVPVSRKPLPAIWWLLMLIVLWKIKYFYVAPLILVLALIYLWDVMEILGSRWWMKLLVIPVALTLIMLLLPLLNPNFAWDYFPEMVYMNHMAFVSKSDPGSYVELPGLCGTWICLLWNFPLAVIAGLFRPFLWEVDTWFQAIVAMENSIYLTLLFEGIFRFRRMRNYSSYQLHRVIGGWIFVILLSGFLALAAPNFGTLERYTVIVTPVLAFLLTFDSQLFRKVIDRIALIQLPLRHG